MIVDRRTALFGSLAAGVAGPALAALPTDPTETIDLWPGRPPGSPATLPTEQVTERSKDPAVPDRAMTGIARPRLYVFRPRAPNGCGLLIAPGGGYQRVVLDKEGFELGRWLSARGWTVFVLFYRLPGEGWADRANVPLADAQRAMRLIRSRAATYRLRPDRIGVMGFSAGGHVCGDLATRFAANVYAPVDAADRLSARPDIAAPIYAVQSMRPPIAHEGSRDLLLGQTPSAASEEAHTVADRVTAATPPCFLAHAEDDPTVNVANTIAMRAALKAAGVPVETHLFEEGGHGFGLRGTVGKPAAAWPELFAAWAGRHGFGDAVARVQPQPSPTR